MDSSDNKLYMKIFHYTTIESLALILSHKTIKFSRLDRVDDLDEGKIKFRGTPLSHIFFASCWSKDENESIAMWKLYTKDGVGVRIELESETIFENKIQCLLENGSKEKIYQDLGNRHYFDTLIITQSLVNYDHNPLAKIQESIMPYKDSNNLEWLMLNSEIVGFTKNISWEFQQ